ncbi:MAG: heat-inducible transcription repressor HrcA [Clostridiales bacterium]|nr:heat-inducible transcription repressor HrcA [Clostridiales bacterium]
MSYDQRKLDILKVIIDDYIETAQPVGSRTVSRKFEPMLSSATIRNEMADLEEMGLLVQPHTSAGRVPAQSAFRIYVDQLMGDNAITPDEKVGITNFYMRHIGDMENLIKSTASLISALTNQPAVALVPQLRRTTLKRLQIIPIIKGAAMVIIVTSTARVKQTVIRVPDNVTDDVLNAISTMMTARFAGHSIADIDVSRIGSVEDAYLMDSKLFAAIEECILDALVLPDGSDVMVEGTTCAFNFPEYSEIEMLKGFLSTFDNRVRLQRLMTEALRHEQCVVIGDENQDEWLNDLSLITAPYKVHGRSVGAIGVIGPMRMDYARVTESLDLISSNLSNVMSLYVNE